MLLESDKLAPVLDDWCSAAVPDDKRKAALAGIANFYEAHPRVAVPPALVATVPQLIGLRCPAVFRLALVCGAFGSPVSRAIHCVMVAHHDAVDPVLHAIFENARMSLHSRRPLQNGHCGGVRHSTGVVPAAPVRMPALLA